MAETMQQRIERMYDAKRTGINRSVALNNAVPFVVEMAKMGKMNGKDRANILIVVLNVAKEFERYLKEGA